MRCSCCRSYKEWVLAHPTAAKELSSLANSKKYYVVLPDEKVVVREDQYVGTIRAAECGPLGCCTGKASTKGPHPYVCSACIALKTAKTSTLQRKLLRAKSLKCPRSVSVRATKLGVTHKYCSREHLELAVQIRRDKNKKLSVATKKLLYSKWHKNASITPFVQTFIDLLSSEKLSTFDFNFLKNWIEKKSKGKYAKADEQARNLAILFSNTLGEKLYTTSAPLLGLPSARQAQRIRAADIANKTYLPGLNQWAFNLAASQERRPFQNGMDGTRIVRIIELYQDKYLIGKAFPPDVRCWPTAEALDTADDWHQIQEYVLNVRLHNSYAPEAFSFNLSDTSGKHADILLGSIPESQSGVTAECIFAIMLKVENIANSCNLSLIGHCTDSAGNCLKALVLLASEETYARVASAKLSFLSLPISAFVFKAPLLRSYPSIAYPCWDHSSRTSLRNLMNHNISIVASVKQNKHGTQEYSIIRHADITPFVKQNCDATSRVITRNVIAELEKFVPFSEATQLYLYTSLCIHEPYRNKRFGPPPAVVESLWTGVTIWRYWRRYIQLSSTLTLSQYRSAHIHTLLTV